jgi:hypothetical protein
MSPLSYAHNCSYCQQNKTDSIIVASERGRRKNKKRGEAGSILPVFAEEWISLTQSVLNDLGPGFLSVI